MGKSFCLLTPFSKQITEYWWEKSNEIFDNEYEHCLMVTAFYLGYVRGGHMGLHLQGSFQDLSL